MRRMRHGALLKSTLRRRSYTTALSCRPTALASLRPAFVGSQCRYSSSSASYPERIAVLGGGVAGLSTAYFVSREFPNSKITIYEAGKDIGGWIKSKRVEVAGGEVIFELGPRTLRNATPTAHLVSPSSYRGVYSDECHLDPRAGPHQGHHIHHQIRTRREEPVHILPRPPEPPALRRAQHPRALRPLALRHTCRQHGPAHRAHGAQARRHPVRRNNRVFPVAPRRQPNSE